MKDFFILIWQTIWFIAKISTAFLAVYYVFIDDLSSATFYVALTCLFVLMDLRDDLARNNINNLDDD